MEPEQETFVNGTRQLSGRELKIAAKMEMLEKKIARQACKDLAFAATNGYTSEAVRALGDGANIDAAVNGYTPLMRAANRGHVGTVATLVAEGADMFVTHRLARTALDWARFARRDKLARILERVMENEICHRRETSQAARDRRELLGVIEANARYARVVASAVGARDLKEVKRAVDHAKLTRREFSSACTRLGLVSDNGNAVSETGKIMATAASAPSVPSTQPTPSKLGLKSNLEGHPPVTFFLDAEARGGTTALALATIENDVGMVRRLIQEGASPWIEFWSGHTALSWAAVCGFDPIVEEILRHRESSDNAVDSAAKAAAHDGKTALHVAALNGNSGVVVILLDRLREMLLTRSFSKRCRSDDAVGPGRGWYYPFRDFVRRKDHEGCIARDLAHKAGHTEVASLLHNAEGRIEAWEARERAEEHAAQRIECGKVDCKHQDRRDKMGRHEYYECPRRPTGCLACGAKFPAEDVGFHMERECSKRRHACPNAMKGCSEVMSHDQIAAHVMHVCKFRRLECRRQCGAILDAHQLEAHERELCRLIERPCVFGCGQGVTKALMDAHIKKHCSKRKVRCRVGCGSEVEAGRLEHHERELCTQACRWEGCEERLGPLVRRQLHERFLCSHRSVECPHGCGISGLTMATKDAHALHYCRLRPVPCPHGCGACYPSIEISTHVRAEGGTCPERLRRCRLDCLGRMVLVTRPGTSESRLIVEEVHEELRDDLRVVPGILRTYDLSTGLFGIRYSDGHKSEALEDLDFVWADPESVSSPRSGGGGSSGPWECGWIAVADMTDHLEQACPLRGTMCRLGCGQRLIVKEAGKHYEGGCPKRSVRCSLGCGIELQHEDLSEHVDATCPLRCVPCVACGGSVPLPDHDEHVSERCPMVPRRCTNGCGSYILGEDLARHLSTECPKRIVPCPLGCPEPKLWAEEIESHTKGDCPSRLFPCQPGCGMQITAGARQVHEEKECSERILTCTCGTRHAFSKTEEHRITACREVLSYCSLGCGVKVRKMDMDKHQEKDCERKKLRNLSKMIDCPLGCGHLISKRWEFDHRVFDCPKRPMQCPRGCSADVTVECAATHFMTCCRRRIRCGANSVDCERMLLTWAGGQEEFVGSHPDPKHQEPDPGYQQAVGRGVVWCSDHGSTPLMWAAGEGDSELALLQELIKVTDGNGINHESHQGDTAMTIASSRGNAETVRILVRQGNVDVNYETCAGKTPLIEAVRHGRTDVVRLLMELGAIVQHANKRMQTAVWWAKRLGHQDCSALMTRAVKTESALEMISSQIARGDIKAVRALVKQGERHRDNHCEHLEAEIDFVTKDLQTANKELRELMALKERLVPEFEGLKASLSADIGRRWRLTTDAERRDARARGVNLNATVNSRSFEAMQSRALRMFRSSAACLQALTEDDFKRIAEETLRPKKDRNHDTDVAKSDDHFLASPNPGGGNGNQETFLEIADPTPSLSALGAVSPRRGEMIRRRESTSTEAQESDPNRQQREPRDQDVHPMKPVSEESKSDPKDSEKRKREWSSDRSAAVSRILRATLLVLGGCGLGALPSDEALWRAVTPMLLDGSLRHRVRHFDRRTVPIGVMDAVRALLNIGNASGREKFDDVSDHSSGTPSPSMPSETPPTTGNCAPLSVVRGGGSEIGVVAPVPAAGRVGGDIKNENSDSEAHDNHPEPRTSSGQEKDDSEGGGDVNSHDGDDPLGDGVGESCWGKNTCCPPIEALGAWCAAVSAYDRLARPPTGSAVKGAIEAESDRKTFERSIARSRLDLELDEFSINLLLAEIAKATASTEFLSRKCSRGKDRLYVARLFSVVSPAGHSLISWAAACGKTGIIEVLLDHGASAGPDDETRAASAAIIQTFYRFHRRKRLKAPLETPHGRERDAKIHTRGRGCNAGLTVTFADRMQTAESMHLTMRERMTYTMEMNRRRAYLAKIRKTRRLPLTEAAYNGHYKVFQLFRARRLPMLGASWTWLYPSAPPPFAPIGDGSLLTYELDAPMSIVDCAAAGLRDCGCKQIIRGRGWVPEDETENRFILTQSAAGAIWREITVAAALRKEKAGKRRALREKIRKQEELLKRMDAEIQGGYLNAPRIVALCQFLRTPFHVSADDGWGFFRNSTNQEGAPIDRETASGMTALISAAEEDPEAVGHEWIQNEEEFKVLAAAFLLDRPIYRPKVDYESRVTGHTALTRACAMGRLETVEALLDRGADINRVPLLRLTTPNHRAVPVTAAGATVTVDTEDDGRVRQPPLVIAAAAGHAAVVRLLLERGANPDIRDRDGKTAVDVARREAFVDVLREFARSEAGHLGVAVGARGVSKPLVPCGWGCGALVAPGHAKTQHEDSCQHREVQCKNSCGENGLQRRQLEHHLAETCRMRPVVCRSRCGMTVVAEECSNHEATACAWRTVVCTSCGSKVFASVLNKNSKETCPKRMVECKRGCGNTVPMASMSRHLDKTCPLTSVPCRLGCGATMWLKMRPEHETGLCSERFVDCKWRCGQLVKAKHIDEHETTQCPHANVLCGNRCGAHLPRGDLKSHYAESCPHRFVPCGRDCGYKIRAKDFTSHEISECGARLITCPRACGVDIFPARALEVHLMYDCALRGVKCASCGEEILARELEPHKKEACRRRLVKCGNKYCCLQLAAEDMMTHGERECSFRRVWCLQGCGQEMRADTRRRHHNSSCPMRYLPCPLGCPKKVRALEADDHADFYCMRRHLG